MRRIVLLLCLAALATGLLAPVAGADPARGAVFSGTGVWIDIWDAYEKTPDKVVALAQQQSVSVIYVETSNAKSKLDVVNPAPLKQLVVLAHAAGIRVVPWYLPGFQKPKVDQRRLAAAMAIGGTEAVDGIAVDIEATYVKSASLRAQRAAALVACSARPTQRRRLVRSRPRPSTCTGRSSRTTNCTRARMRFFRCVTHLGSSAHRRCTT